MILALLNLLYVFPISVILSITAHIMLKNKVVKLYVTWRKTAKKMKMARIFVKLRSDF